MTIIKRLGKLWRRGGKLAIITRIRKHIRFRENKKNYKEKKYIKEFIAWVIEYFKRISS